MCKDIVGPLVVLVVTVVLYSDLVWSQCTTKYCENNEETNLLSVCMRNQEVIEQFQQLVKQLQQQLKSNQDETRRLQQDIIELKQQLTTTINECESNPCQHGTCRDEENKYSCLCDAGYNGLNCETHVARSCKQILEGAPDSTNGVYWICASSNCIDAVEIFCDMRSGGWTLIGQIGGASEESHDKWLMSNENVDILKTPVIEDGVYGCICRHGGTFRDRDTLQQRGKQRWYGPILGRMGLADR